MNKLFYIVIIIAIIIFVTKCNSDIKYYGNKDLIGNWEAKTIDIFSPSNEHINFAIKKYGYSYLSFSRDSSFNFILKLFKDVVLKKDVFGNPYEKTILKSGYENYKSGYYLASDSIIIFYDNNKIISNRYNYIFAGNILYTKFADKENNQWEISWEK